jgi:hypothetical protein
MHGTVSLMVKAFGHWARWDSRLDVLPAGVVVDGEPGEAVPAPPPLEFTSGAVDPPPPPHAEIAANKTKAADKPMYWFV